MFSSSCRSLLLCVCLSLTGVWGADIPTPQTSPATEAPAKEVKVAEGAFVRAAPLPAWAQPLAAVPDSKRSDPLVIRLAETQFHVGARPEVLVNFAEQANDSASLGSIGQFPLIFDPEYQTLRLHKLLVLRGKEVLDRTAQANVRFLQRETSLDQGMYAGALTAMFLLDDIRVGDTMQITYSIEGQNPVFGGVYADSASWDRSEPVELRRVWLIHPVQRKIAWRQLGDFNTTKLQPEISESDGVRRLKFEERGLEVIEGEVFMPSDYVSHRFLQFSEYADWNAVARWAAAMFPPVSDLPPELQSLLGRLRKLPSKEAQAVAALEWVQGEIRYFSVSLGESSHRPHPPAEVLKRRFGDCKDKTYLLVTLLNALGIEAHPLLLSTATPRFPARLAPTSMVFDHVIVAARIQGASYFLDGTRLGQHGQIAKLGPVFPNAKGLLVDPATQDLIDLSYPQLRELVANDLKESFSLQTLAGDGSLQVKQVFHGNDAELLRFAYGRMTVNQQRQAALSNYERRYPGVELLDGPKIDDNGDANVFTISSRYKIPKLAIEKNGVWGIRYFPSNLSGMFSMPQQAQRKFPLAQARAPSVATYHVSIDWPTNVSAHTDPSVERIKSDFFDLEAQQSFRGNHMSMDLTFALNAERIAAKDVPRLFADVKKMDSLPTASIVTKTDIVETSAAAERKTLAETLRLRFNKDVERISATLKADTLQGEDRAYVLCDRAAAYYNLGDYSQGLLDAQEAVRIAPSLGRAYQCRADMYAALGTAGKAVEDYTKSISLGEEASDAFYARGRARAYVGQFASAATDFGKARVADKAGGLYAALWEAWALQRLGQPLSPALLDLAKQAPTGAWPRPALAMLVDAITPAQMLAEVNAKRDEDRELCMAEALYYLGQYHLIHGDKAAAKKAFQGVRDSGVSMYNEYVAAQFELQLLEGGTTK